MKHFVWLLPLALILVGCVSTMESAGRAWDAQNWDDAARLYSKALEGGVAPEEAVVARERAPIARERAAAAHLQAARAHQTAGNLSRAIEEAEEAMEFDNGDEVAQLLAELRQARGAQFLATGREDLRAGRLDAAVRNLRQAQQLASSAEGTTLLAQAQQAAAESHAAAFEEAMTPAEATVAGHDWSRALSSLQAAAQHGDSARSRTLHGFVSAMMAAERSAATGDFLRAEAEFRSARAFGVQNEYVDERARQILPRAYRITVHGAVILPFKPSDHRRWDGLPGSSFSQAQSVLASLRKVTGSPEVMWAEAVAVVGQYANEAYGPPDCYPVILVANGRVDTGQQVVKDSLEPGWNAAISVRTSPADGRVFALHVFDNDLQNDDPVGSIQWTLGELVAEPGVHHIILFDESGNLRADAVLAVKLSVAEE